ncbi:MAG TPA: JAB domain-containing protein [Candidatus Saccharimonadia bacterium]|nr:JAB domain-containing protein [Candidatus Saccharimonadia bacterium]
MEDILLSLKFIRNKRQEYFICLSLDTAGRIIRRRTVTIGLLDMSLAHPREVFAGPIKDRAAGVIIAHNHPSGYASPSDEDIKTTQQLVAAGQILGIRLQDHIIVTADDYFSFRQRQLL